jgi:hypothetical protein
MPDHAYVAYLDILGYRQLLQEDVSNGSYQFRDRMIRAFRAFDDVNTARYAYRAISDSIFISCGERNAAEEFLYLLRKVFICFLAEGLLIRGGASYGAHFQNQTITYSPVLTKAYLLESNIAQFPRIMVDPNILEMFPNLTTGGLILASGKNLFLNIVTEETFDSIWANAKNAFEASRNAIRVSEEVRIKHRWLQEYLSESANKLGLEVPPSYIGVFDTDILSV